MIPIQDLLHRIRWDPTFGAARYTIGYYDRPTHRIVTVPLECIDLPSGHRFSFAATLADGTVHEVPFHRVREVHRDGQRIWQRSVAGESTLEASHEKHGT